MAAAPVDINAQAAVWRYKRAHILSVGRENRPSRLLGPAVPWSTTFLDRGVCPVCGVTVQECGAVHALRPLDVGSHGYSRITYPDLAQRPA